MAKLVLFDEKSRQALERGRQCPGRWQSKSRWGQKGRNRRFRKKKFGAPQIVNDGITIAKEIELDDPYENTGARLIQEVASKTNDLAGDGTTTATVLAQALIREGLKNVAAGANPIGLRRGIEKATAQLVNDIAAAAKPIEGSDIARVAAVSSGNDEMVGGMIASAMDKVTKKTALSRSKSPSL